MEIQQAWRKPWQWWNAYWFRNAPLFDLAICRILIVFFQLVRLFINNIWGELAFYTTLPDFLYQPLPVLQVLMLGADYRPPLILLAIVFTVTVLSGILGVIGLFTNLNLIIFALGNIFLQGFLYSFRDYHHSEALVMISVLAIAFTPAGKILSLDDLLTRIRKNSKQGTFKAFDVKQEKSIFAQWSLLLIQWIFAIIYLDSAISKLLKSGLDWMNGYTLQYYLWQDGLIWERPFGIWFAQQHTLAIISSWVAIIFELTFFLVLIFPRLVWFYIPLGISFHTGIYIAQKAPFIKYFPSYSVFIPWAAIARNFSRRNQQVEIIYNPQSCQQIKLVTILCYFDWFNRLKFKEKNQLEIQLFSHNMTLKKDFLAFRTACCYLPPLWLLLPFLYLPRRITLSIYRLISK